MQIDVDDIASVTQERDLQMGLMENVAQSCMGESRSEMVNIDLSDNDDTTTLASLQSIPSKKSAPYKFWYNAFMKDCATWATAVQNRLDVAAAAHGTVVALI